MGFVVETNGPRIFPNMCWPPCLPKSSSVGQEVPISSFPSVLGILARLWHGTEAAGQSSSCSAFPQAMDGLEPHSSVMRNNSLTLALINIPHFNNMFGTGGSCQQKLWSLVPHPPTGHENKSAVSFKPAWRVRTSPSEPSCLAKWGPEDHQCQVQGVRAEG